MNDLDLVAGHDPVLGVARAGHDGPVDLHGNRTFGEPEVIDEPANGEVLGHVALRAVDGDPHEEKLPSP